MLNLEDLKELANTARRAGAPPEYKIIVHLPDGTKIPAEGQYLRNVADIFEQAIENIMEHAIANALKNVIEEKGLCSSNISERCLVHRLAIHLEKTNVFNEYIIDCEYNRMNYGIDKKRCDGKLRTPDLIIHKERGNCEGNLAVFEVKKSNNLKEQDKDEEKLRCYIKFLKYEKPFFIIIPVTKQLKRYQKGDIVISDFIKPIKPYLNPSQTEAGN